MRPVGLTRAEELGERPARSVAAARAPRGRPACRCVTLPSGDECGAPATRRIMWPDAESDRDRTPACQDCVIRMGEIARSHGTVLKTEPLP